MSPQAASSSKWDRLPERDPNRPVIYIEPAAKRLSYTRTAVERAVHEGRLEGCRDMTTGKVKIAVYVDALEVFPVRERTAASDVSPMAPAAAETPTAAGPRRPVRKRRSTTPPATSDGMRPRAVRPHGTRGPSPRVAGDSDVVAIIVQLVDSIDRYERGGRRTDVARALLDAAKIELEHAADERSAGTAVLRALAEDTLMPDTVADLLRRLDRTEGDGDDAQDGDDARDGGHDRDSKSGT